ncbi:crossover junction endodeoxyribonuclease RuvC [Chlamydia pecorum]|uniref:Crossover junction endodeoxyribonuclease RuvC n=1 Tax=Chlamydia pecorum (strain ATCC VR-628 / DSM 29919 / E58) TaxID=331635 RepID=A0AA34RCU6_CHLPE|nr:crossover junction endodeoxyribonuclease RuvC [Chlamydia pecorum]AEB41422.1 crossover junction endodeoxyribonuclease RuvC [Chlamydia pecorum E58]AGW38549.1 crossover junction endodeoxyribonuclease [Chlamydia pecorum W73]AGW39474.1 crossover junction endodeoxyribonuclease [Chlamydia pecorum P787]ETF38772.1 crossover junction endodeoxyribonuclease RuvC [Chlamydia pecorum VR629]UFP06981.1 crossover junction endodeoxyribonuclease RuvC [Chlamydia pecorum]
MTQLIMGVDPGTIAAGYAILRVEARYQLSAHSYGVVRLSPKLLLSQRYKKLFLEISKVLEDVSPDVLVLETQFVSKNPQSTIKLGMARGVVLLAAALKEIPIVEYTPNVAKKAVVGRGGASKQQVQLMVSKMLGLPELVQPDCEDIADAFALAICHTHMHSYASLGVL